MDLDCRLELLEYLVVCIGLLNLILVDEELHMDVLNDFATLDSHI
jgi:hypothetical protein